MKPIEPGCLAIVIRSRCPDNLGKVVRPVRYHGEIPLIRWNDMWEIDIPLNFRHRSTGEIRAFPFAPERCLMRIDGYEDDQTERIGEAET